MGYRQQFWEQQPSNDDQEIDRLEQKIDNMRGHLQHYQDLAAGLQKEVDELRKIGPEEIETDLKEMCHYYGMGKEGWDKLRAIINDLEDRDNEAAFDRWSERRYSIDG